MEPPVNYILRIDSHDGFKVFFQVEKTPGVVLGEIGRSLDICLARLLRMSKDDLEALS